VRLTILGSSAAYPGPGGACSGYLIEEDNTKILIDCGTGVLSNLQKVTTLEQVEHIIISHLHADHFFDLIPYRYALFRPTRKGIKPFLHLPPGGKQALQGTVSAFDTSPTFFSDYFETEEYRAGGELDIEGLRIEFEAVKHYIPAYALAMSGDRKFVYSADTGLCDGIDRIAQGADLFLCEAAHCQGDEPEWGHMSASEASELASKSNVKKLVLTHFWPDCDYSHSIRQAKDILGDKLDVAVNMETFEV